MTKYRIITNSEGMFRAQRRVFLFFWCDLEKWWYHDSSTPNGIITTFRNYQSKEAAQQVIDRHRKPAAWTVVNEQ